MIALLEGSSCHKVGFDAVGTRCTNAKYIRYKVLLNPYAVYGTGVEDDSMMQGRQSRYIS